MNTTFILPHLSLVFCKIAVDEITAITPNGSGHYFLSLLFHGSFIKLHPHKNALLACLAKYGNLHLPLRNNYTCMEHVPSDTLCAKIDTHVRECHNDGKQSAAVPILL